MPPSIVNSTITVLPIMQQMIFSVHHVLSSTAILINTLNQEGLISKFYLLQTVSVLAEIKRVAKNKWL
jgi:hypothetical protein